MSKVVNRTAVDEIILADGDRVTVRQQLAAAEEAILANSAIRCVVDSASGVVRMSDIDPFRARIEICKAYVVGWNFRDDDGAPIPYTPAIVDELDGAVVVEIAENIDRLQRARREVQEKKGVPS